MKHGFVIDLDRCIGCKGCQVACKQENGVALGANRTLVRTVGPMGSYPDVQMYFLPTPCQQCADPPCVQVCPTGACWQNREGSNSAEESIWTAVSFRISFLI